MWWLDLQVAAAHNLMENTRKTVEGRAKLGIEAFAQALLGIPKILAENSGYDAQETIIKLQVVQHPSVPCSLPYMHVLTWLVFMVQLCTFCIMLLFLRCKAQALLLGLSCWGMLRGFKRAFLSSLSCGTDEHV